MQVYKFYNLTPTNHYHFVKLLSSATIWTELSVSECVENILFASLYLHLPCKPHYIEYSTRDFSQCISFGRIHKLGIYKYLPTFEYCGHLHQDTNNVFYDMICSLVNYCIYDFHNLIFFYCQSLSSRKFSLICKLFSYPTLLTQSQPRASLIWAELALVTAETPT